MDRLRRTRKWLPVVCALLLSGCGDDADEPAAEKAAPAASSALAKRCSLQAESGDGGFPGGLLPDASVVIADGRALVEGELIDVFKELRTNAGDAGLTVRDSELETFDAEIALEGDDGEVGLRLEPARDCEAATDVSLD